MDEYVIELDDVVDIASVSNLYKKLLSACISDAPIVIQASSIERIDTAGLQLLTGFIQELSSSNHDFKWKAPSENFNRAARYLGLEKPLRLI